MKEPRMALASLEHEEAYHAALRCQAAALRLLSLTSARLRGLRSPCPSERQKRGWSFASHPSGQKRLILGNPPPVNLLGPLKGLGAIFLFVTPQSVNDVRPDIGQRPHRDRVALALGSFALVVRQSPWLTQSRLPGKLLHGITQGLDAGIPSMGFRIDPALKEDGGSPGQGLQAGSARITAPIVSDFCQQSGREPDACQHEASFGSWDCQHASKKGVRSPCRSWQSPPPEAATA